MAWLQRFDSELSISRRIGFGYLVAIGLGFTGTIAGLLFADYLQGKSLEQLGDAQQQARLLQGFQTEAQTVQISGLQLAAAVDGMQTFQARRQRLHRSLQEARDIAQELEAFLSSDPKWLAAEARLMRSLLRRYLEQLDNYVTQLERVSQPLGVPRWDGASFGSRSKQKPVPQQTQQRVQRALHALPRPDTTAALAHYQQELWQLIRTAQDQESAASEEMEYVQGFEKLIIILSALGSVAIAGFVAMRTTQAIVRPLKQVEETAQQVVAGANFSLRLPATNQDEVSSLARSFNQLICWVDEYTQDLTEALDTLKRTQAQLVQTEKMSSLGQMLAGIAHELNNPIGFISGNLPYAHDYLQELLAILQLYEAHLPHPPAEVVAAHTELAFLRQDYPRLLNSMAVGADRICGIVASLRAFSRMDQAFPRLTMIEQGIDSTLMLLQHRLKAQPHRPAITVSKHYGSVPQVECYPGPLNQVLMNLLVNAIDAIEECHKPQSPVNHPATDGDTTLGQICICTRMQQNQVEIAITDNGGGIPEDKRPRIFDPFFTTKPEGKGTGLGLSISYQIVVELHSGTLTCDSELGKGTTFTVRIPLRQS